MPRSISKSRSSQAALLSFLFFVGAWSLYAEGRLTEAVKSGNISAVRSLVKAGADANEPGADGSTPLIWAVRSANADITDVLLAAGAKPDAVSRYRVTPLNIAAEMGNAAILESLLAAGADVHARNRRGQEALHAASCGSPGSRIWNPSAQTATIMRLVEAGADPNVHDKSGVSPLHKAIRTRCAAAVRTLLDLGADPAGRNKNGSTPMLLAMQNTGQGGTGSEEAKLQQQEILRLLEERATVK